MNRQLFKNKKIKQEEVKKMQWWFKYNKSWIIKKKKRAFKAYADKYKILKLISIVRLKKKNNQ